MCTITYSLLSPSKCPQISVCTANMHIWFVRRLMSDCTIIHVTFLSTVVLGHRPQLIAYYIVLKRRTLHCHFIPSKCNLTGIITFNMNITRWWIGCCCDHYWFLANCYSDFLSMISMQAFNCSINHFFPNGDDKLWSIAEIVENSNTVSCNCSIVTLYVKWRVHIFILTVTQWNFISLTLIMTFKKCAIPNCDSSSKYSTLKSLSVP